MESEYVCPRCFSEGKLYLQSEYNDIRPLLNNKKIIALEKKSFKFIVTGFIVVNDRLIVIFPKNYKMPENIDSIKEEASILLKTLMKYRTEKLHSNEETELMYGGSEFSSYGISNAVFIASDFVNNGAIIRNTQLKTNSKNGRVNWNATINKVIPMVNHNRPVYFPPIMNATVIDTMSIITQIHHSIANECLQLWGWLVGFSNTNPCAVDLPVSVQEAVRLLKKELEVTYAQRDIEVLKAMVSYLEDKSGGENSKKILVLATPYFYYVWESICGYVFENDYIKLSQIIPQPEWKSHIKKFNISQKPDILFVADNSFYILDAKYYDYNKNLPGWHDVVKQIFYKLSIEKAITNEQYADMFKNINHIANIFVLPDNTKHYIRYLGLVNIEDIPEFGNVHAFSINTKEAMQSYAYSCNAGIKIDLIKKYEESCRKTCQPK